MTYHPTTRRRLRAGAAALAVVGVAALATGLWASGPASGPGPVPVPTATTTHVPEAGPLNGPVALYGVPTTAPVTAERLGCSVDGGQGTTTGADRLDRLVVAQRAVVPLMVLTGTGPGSTIACSGPDAATSGPLYLVVAPGNRELLPMAAFSLATLGLVLGVAGLISLRPQD